MQPGGTLGWKTKVGGGHQEGEGEDQKDALDGKRYFRQFPPGHWLLSQRRCGSQPTPAKEKKKKT